MEKIKLTHQGIISYYNRSLAFLEHTKLSVIIMALMKFDIEFSYIFKIIIGIKEINLIFNIN